MNHRLLLLSLALSAPAIASAQATDPATVGQIMTQRGTAEGYADRGRERQRDVRPKALSDDCTKLWKMRDGMTRAEKRKLYDLCPR